MSKGPRAASGTLRHLKLQAKHLLDAARAAEPSALQRLARLRSPRDAADLRLADAQLAIAREWGLPSWAKLKVRAAELDLARAGAEEVVDPTGDVALDEAVARLRQRPA